MTQKWKYTEGDLADLTADKVRQFINDYKLGKAEKVYKSEPVPEKLSGFREVRKIVGKTWDSTIMDSTKEVFVATISEFCRACREVEEDWQLLAQQTPQDLIIATYNIDQNEIEGQEKITEPMPIYKFYPKDNKQGIVYEADKTLQDFKNWLNENSPAYRAANPNHKEENDAVNDEL